MTDSSNTTVTIAVPGRDAIVLAERAAQATTAAGVLVMLLGLVVLVVGWWGGVDAVTHLLPTLESMKANTAVGFILLGGGLLALGVHAPRWAAVVPGLATSVLGVLTVIEYWAGAEFGIDELLAADPTSTGTPGRMGLNTAIAFAVVGLALALASRPAPRLRLAAQALAVASGGIATLAFLGYVYDVTAARGLASATEMALHTAAGLIVVAIGLSAATSDVGLISETRGPSTSAILARTTFTTAVLSVIGAAAFSEILRRTGVITQTELSLAVTATLSVAVVGASVLLVARRVRLAEEDTEVITAGLGTILDAVGDLHYRVDQSGMVLDRHGSRTLPSGDTTAVGRQLADLYPTEAAIQIRAAIESAVGGVAVDVTYLEDAQYDPRTFEVQVIPFGDELAVADRDITRVAEANQLLRGLNDVLEERVAERTDELETANQELERFAYVASHDLQEPLRMVSSFVGRLQEMYGDQFDEEGREYLHFAVDGAERMSALINALLEFSRVGTGKLEKVVEVPLRGLVDDVLAMMGAGIEDAGASVVIGEDLPTVRCDPTLMGQVVQNLVGNALKFSSPDRPPVVTVDARPGQGENDKYWVIIVEDNGIGIPEEYAGRIFEMFRRLHGRGKYPGTGIGLAIVQRIVERHGGKIWTESVTTGGTRFLFTLPLSAPLTGKRTLADAKP